MHAYQSPKGGRLPPNGGATAPGPRGLRPRPCRFALGGSPCYLPSGRSVCKTMGSFSRSERSGSRLLAGGQLLAVVHGATPKGSVGARKPRPVFSFRVEDPRLGVAKPPPRAPQGSRLSVGKCSESTYRRKWQNGGMAHFAILRVQKLVRGGGPSLHEAQLQSAGHAKRRRRADALNEHFGAHSVAEGMAAFRSRLPESFRKDAVQAVEYLITASPEAMQGKPKASRTPTSGTR